MSKELTFLDFLKDQRSQPFFSRVERFSQGMGSFPKGENLFMREVLSPMDREVIVKAFFEEKPRTMLMFGSNNYLGLANHPYIKERVQGAIEKYGTGVAGPPLLNGYTTLMHQLEELLTQFKHQEAALIFSSGYGANFGLFSSLPTQKDIVLVDSEHHASCFDGLTFKEFPYKTFPHNDMEELERLLQEANEQKARDIFIAIEGVYSMRGDIAPLDTIVALSKKYNAHVILDDAHGTGVFGKYGHGTAEHFGVENDITITMGTFSKAFAVSGGFITSSKDIVHYLRYFARPYVFSASMAPPHIASIIAAIELMQKDQTLHKSLWENVHYAKQQFERSGFTTTGQSPIMTLPVPKNVSIRKANHHFHELGIFLNSVEVPAVPRGKECFRISVTAAHTKQDIDYLVSCAQKVWSTFQ